MRLSELLHRSVVDADGGESFGVVVDVRLVLDGPTDSAGEPTYRVDGLVVGRRAAVARLGLLGRDVHGPALLVRPARWFGGHRDYVPWTAVQSYDGDIVRITGRPVDLPVTTAPP